MSKNEYKEGIQEAIRILRFAIEGLDESLNNMDRYICTNEETGLTFSRLDALSARDYIKTGADLLFKLATSKID